MIGFTMSMGDKFVLQEGFLHQAARAPERFFLGNSEFFPVRLK